MGNMPKWERHPGVYHSLVEEFLNERDRDEGKLGFNRLSIIASDIAEQYFCEKKVEMQYLYGRVDTSAC